MPTAWFPPATPHSELMLHQSGGSLLSSSLQFGFSEAGHRMCGSTGYPIICTAHHETYPRLRLFPTWPLPPHYLSSTCFTGGKKEEDKQIEAALHSSGGWWLPERQEQQPQGLERTLAGSYTALVKSITPLQMNKFQVKVQRYVGAKGNTLAIEHTPWS